VICCRVIQLSLEEENVQTNKKRVWINRATLLSDLQQRIRFEGNIFSGLRFQSTSCGNVWNYLPRQKLLSVKISCLLVQYPLFVSAELLNVFMFSISQSVSGVLVALCAPKI